MRGILRLLASVAAGFSLVICIGMLALWVRGYWCHEALVVARLNVAEGSWWQEDVRLGAGGGSVSLWFAWAWGAPPEAGVAPPVPVPGGPWRIGHESWARPKGMPFPFGKFGYINEGNPTVGSYSASTGYFCSAHIAGWVPIWLVVGTTATPPACLFWRRRQRRRTEERVRRGLCARCGYDIRASPARCSECGTLAKGA